MERSRAQSLEFAKDGIIKRSAPKAVIHFALKPRVYDRHPKDMHDAHPISRFRT